MQRYIGFFKNIIFVVVKMVKTHVTTYCMAERDAANEVSSSHTEKKKIGRFERFPLYMIVLSRCSEKGFFLFTN